jgi:hypothetical protein
MCSVMPHFALPQFITARLVTGFRCSSTEPSAHIDRLHTSSQAEEATQRSLFKMSQLQWGAQTQIFRDQRQFATENLHSCAILSLNLVSPASMKAESRWACGLSHLMSATVHCDLFHKSG